MMLLVILLLSFVILSIVGFLLYKYIGVSSRARKNGWDRQSLKKLHNAILAESKKEAVKNVILKSLINMCMSSSLTNCLVENISEQIKYKSSYTTDLSSIDSKVVEKNLINCLPSCLGTKGNWNPKLKKFFVSVIETSSIESKLANCIADNLEAKFSPSDLLKDLTDNNLQKILSDITALCV